MASNLIVVDPPTLFHERQVTENILGNLTNNSNKVYSKIEELVNQFFNTPGLIDIATEIANTKGDTQKIISTVQEYSMALGTTGKIASNADAEAASYVSKIN